MSGLAQAVAAKKAAYELAGILVDRALTKNDSDAVLHAFRRQLTARRELLLAEMALVKAQR